RDAEARGHANRPVLRPERVLRERDAQALRGRERAGLVRLAEDERELLASEAARRVRRAERLVEELADALQHLVAERMAVRVVERLERVDVEEHERQNASVALRRRDFFTEPLIEVRAVPDARERVDVRARREQIVI